MNPQNRGGMSGGVYGSDIDDGFQGARRQGRGGARGGYQGSNGGGH